MNDPGEAVPAAVAGVCVVVVNFRAAALTLRAVNSVRRSTGIAVHTIVVDNGSGDGSAEQFSAEWSGVADLTILAQAVNAGFTGGSNAGVAIAKERGARWALLLNNDAVIEPDAIRRLVEEGERGDRVALLNPCILLGAPSTLLWFGGARYSPWSGRPVHVGRQQAAAHGWDAPRDLPFATGCALLVRLDAVSDAPFDVSLFGYAEDLDLSLRLRRAGWRLRYVPTAVVRHDDGTTYRRAGGDALRFYFGTRNLIRVAARHARWFHWPVLAPMLAVNVVARHAISVLRHGDVAACVAVLRGTVHAVTGGRHAIEPPRAAPSASQRAAPRRGQSTPG
jgi:hypothetical protein